MLRQDVSYFDQDENSAGALTSSLSKGANDLAGISGATFGAILSLITTIFTAIILSVAIGWKLGLVCGSTIPILLACGFLRFQALARFEARASKAYRASAAMACEAVSAIPTIASLTREADVWDSYHAMLRAQLSNSLRSILPSSLLFAAAQSFSFFCMALGFWYGARLILAGEYSLFQFFVCFNSVIFSSQNAGGLFSFAPDMAKSKHAAQQLKNLCDRVPPIDTWSETGSHLPEIRGHVDFRDVDFAYPSRGSLVLRGLNLTIEPRQSVAFVGTSGCGKSTAIRLLERFYSPSSGAILVDGQDIATLNVHQYRSVIALVSQEPVLFHGSVRENIVLGIADDEDVAEEKIMDVCKKANIWDFIVRPLPPLSNHMVRVC
jgi:ATP-binding cassette subfamily B (MDR/TAP) protein 1